LLTIGTGVLALALVVTALVAPGYRERQRLAALNSEVARLEPEVRAVEQIQRELERRRTLLGTMRSVEAAALKPLPVLRELTDLLPNDAWLTLLSLDAKGVELTGQAAAASNLIPVLENSPRFERAEFASPVTRGRDREQFRILAKWEPGGASAAAPAAPAPGTPAAVPPGAGAPRQARPAAPPGPGPAAPGAPVQPRQAPPSAAAQPAQPPPAIGPRQLPPDEDSVLTPESPPPRRPVQSLPRVRQ
jgi:Tfp pilus assembly protein PilN